MTERWILICLALAGCSKKAAIGAACKTTGDCVSGAFCLDDKCGTVQCETNRNCGADQICTAAFRCQNKGTAAGSSGGGNPATLAVTDVRGDVDASTVPAPSDGTVAPEGFWTQSSFFVIGTGFDTSVSAQLLNSAQTVIANLVVSSAQASSFSAALPASLVAGTYTLRVSTTSGGSVTRDVSILQGPPGPPGADGTLPSPFTSQILVNRNAMTPTSSTTAADAIVAISDNTADETMYVQGQGHPAITAISSGTTLVVTTNVSNAFLDSAISATATDTTAFAVVASNTAATGVAGAGGGGLLAIASNTGSQNAITVGGGGVNFTGSNNVVLGRNLSTYITSCTDSGSAYICCNGTSGDQTDGSASAGSKCPASCNATSGPDLVLGGGCNAGAAPDSINESAPANAGRHGWRCKLSNSSAGNVTTSAVCLGNQ